MLGIPSFVLRASVAIKLVAARGSPPTARSLACTECPPQVMKRWNDLVMNPNISKKEHPSHGILVPIFQGIREFSGGSQGYRRTQESTHSVSDKASLAELQADLDKTMEAATHQFAAAPCATPQRDPEVTKQMVPAHLAQGLVEAKARSTFFDQLIYKELAEIEEVDAKKEEYFERELALAEQYVKSTLKDDSGSPGKSVAKGCIEVKVMHYLTMQKTVRGKMQASHDACESTSSQVLKYLVQELNDADEECMKSLQEALNTASKNNSAPSLDLMKKVGAIDIRAEMSNDPDALKETLKSLMGQHRGVIKDWKKTIGAVEKQMNKFANAIVVAEGKDKDCNVGECPVSGAGKFLHTCTLVGKKELNIVADLKKFDEGRPSLKAAKAQMSSELLESLMGMGVVKTALKACWKFIDEDSGRCYATSLVQNVKSASELRAKLEEFLEKRSFDSIAFHPRDMGWASGIYGLQGWACTSAYTYSGISPFAVQEFRVVTQGSLVVGGMPVSKVPGNTYGERLAWLESSSGQDLDSLVQSEGWAVRLEAGDVFLLPVGHVSIVFPTTTRTEGLRWGCHDSNDEEAILKLSSALIDTFPSLKSSAYSSWVTFLSHRVARSNT